jgi:cysteine desulfurase/selenocysteine lyase
MAYSVNNVRNDFPLLLRKVDGKPLVYLDNGATTQKPAAVIERITKYYLEENSNVHRGAHRLSQLATDAYENARSYVADFINAGESSEVIFTKGTTESINLLSTVLEPWVTPGDEIVVSAMEHHSNLVPWQQLCIKRKAKLKILPVDLQGNLDLEMLNKILNHKTKLLAVTHISNVLGTVNPVKQIVKIAHDAGVPVLIDGAQGIAHAEVDVKDLGVDFYVFSGHKVYAPMGIGVLYGRKTWLRRLPPYQYGGEMIDRVSFEETTFNQLPYKYEAGTPNVEGAIALEAALKYLKSAGKEKVFDHESKLLTAAEERLKNIEGVRIVGNAHNKAAVLSFVVNGIHHYDLGTLLDKMGVAVRTGHHCAQPLMDFLGLRGTVRASFAMYNTLEDVDIFAVALEKAVNMLR